MLKCNAKKSRKGVGGRPQKMSKRDKRKLIRTIKVWRKEDANWTVKGLMARADVQDVSRHTVSRFLNLSGYNYLQARKKGLLSNDDKKSAQNLQNSCSENIIKIFGLNEWHST